MVDCGNLPPGAIVPGECRPVRVPARLRPAPLSSPRMATAAAVGAAVDQTAARAMEARFLDYIRAAGSGSPPHASWQYLGGDVTDVFVANGGSTAWIGADWLAGTTIDADDTYTADALPFRNGVILAVDQGTFDGAGQQFATGGTGVWLNAVAQGGLPSGTLWWPIAGLNDGGTNRILCWHVDNNGAHGPWGRLLDSHIVTLNVFGGYGSHVELGIDPDLFVVDGVVQDTTHTYVYGEQFVPDYDADLANDRSVPNYGRGSLGEQDGQFTVKRVARVVNGGLTTLASWEWWTGSDWSGEDVTDAPPMVDQDGFPVAGDAGVARIEDDHWLLVAHRLTDSHVNVYTAEAPQGPWTLIARVPAPPQGAVINGGRQIGQLTKIVPEAEHPDGTPAEHRIAMMSRNTIPVDGHTMDPMSDRNIRRYAPQFVVVPVYGRPA